MATNPFSSPLATHIGGALVYEIAKLVQLTPVSVVYATEKLYSTNKTNAVNEPTISNYATPRVNKPNYSTINSKNYGWWYLH